MDWIAVSLRHVRAARVASLTLALFVLVTASLFGVAPRLLELAADQALRSRVAAAQSQVRNIQLLQRGRLPLDDPGTPLAEVDATGARLEGQFPEEIRSLLVDRYALVASPRWLGVPGRIDERSVKLRAQEAVAGHLHVIAGRLPEGPAEAPVEPAVDPSRLRLEVALTSASAHALGVDIGATLDLSLDPSDVLGSGRGQHAAITIEVVGVFEIVDPADAYWFDDSTLAKPSVRSPTPLVQIQDVTVLMAQASYPALMAVTADEGIAMRYTWRYSVDPARFASDGVEVIHDGMRRMESVFPASIAGGGNTLATELRTGLLGVIEEHLAGWRAVESVLAAVAVGAAAVALAALGLVIVLGAQRRRLSVAMWRGRGATRGQVYGSALAEGLLLVGPATLLALVLAIALVPSGPNLETICLALGTAGLGVVLVVATIPRDLIGPAAARAGEAVPPPRPSPRRLVLEGVFVALAVVGAFLLRQRGVQGVSSTGALTTSDPLIAAVPALLGIAGGLVAVRLFPIPARAMAALAARQRGLVAGLALRRVARGTSSQVVLLALLATTAVSAFSSAVLVHLDRGADTAAWYTVGADYSVTLEQGKLPDTLDAAALPGVEAVATADRGRATLSDGGHANLLAIDLADYSAVTSGTSGDPHVPAAMLVAADGTADIAAAPIPVIVSTSLAGGPHPLAVGTPFELRVGGRPVAAVVAAIRETFPTLPLSRPFIVASRQQLQAAAPGTVAGNAIAFLRAPGDAGPALRQAVAAVVPDAVVLSRVELTETARSSPATHAIVSGVSAAAIASALYAALAVTAALALIGAGRAVEVAHLRAMGISRREAAGLVIVENVPTLAIALAAGAALGYALFVVLRSGLGLSALLGSRVPVPIDPDAGQLALLALVVVVIGGVGISLAVALQGRVEPAAALRQAGE